MARQVNAEYVRDLRLFEAHPVSPTSNSRDLGGHAGVSLCVRKVLSAVPVARHSKNQVWFW